MGWIPVQLPRKHRWYGDTTLSILLVHSTVMFESLVRTDHVTAVRLTPSNTSRYCTPCPRNCGTVEPRFIKFRHHLWQDISVQTKVTGWWFGTWMDYFPQSLGWWSNLTTMFLGGWLKPPIRQVFKLALVPCEVSAGHGTLTNQTVAALGCAFPVFFSACFGQNDARFHQIDGWSVVHIVLVPPVL